MTNRPLKRHFLLFLRESCRDLSLIIETWCHVTPTVWVTIGFVSVYGSASWCPREEIFNCDIGNVMKSQLEASFYHVITLIVMVEGGIGRLYVCLSTFGLGGAFSAELKRICLKTLYGQWNHFCLEWWPLSLRPRSWCRPYMYIV